MDIEEDVDLALVEEEDRAQVEEELVVVDEEEEEPGIALQAMTRWHAIAMGCVAIWPVTVPKQCSHREVELPTLPVEDLLNPCSEAHVAEEEAIDRFDSVASVFCMTTRVTNTPLMMQDSCMCHLNLGRLLSMV